MGTRGERTQFTEAGHPGERAPGAAGPEIRIERVQPPGLMQRPRHGVVLPRADLGYDEFQGSIPYIKGAGGQI
jgi:hypothetical protein